MPASTLIRRALYLLACLAPVWAVMAFATDGVILNLGILRLKATEPVRPLIIGAVAAGFYIWRHSREAFDADGRWLLAWVGRAAPVATVAMILVGGAIGIYYGSFTAGGSDSYGYVSQASLWLKGSLRIEQPWVQQFSWANREWTFAPLGYRPLSPDGTIVPTYAPGLPIVMALFQGLVGANGPFLVVPAFGAMALWLTYLLGRHVTGSRAVGALAALLLLSSPVFLMHLLLPMTDVPVAAGWTLVALLALREPRPRTLAAGLVAGATLMIRPNLALLALAPVITWRGWPSYALRFAMGLAPALIAIAAFNAYLYGSPLTSGYGALVDIYDWRSAWPNLKHYGVWLIQTQTPIVALAAVPLVMPKAFRPEIRMNALRCLASLAALTFVSYIFYSPFELWTYLRFLLPAYPTLFVLMAAGIRSMCARLPIAMRAPVAMLIATVCVASSFVFVRDQFIFSTRAFERRHIRAAEEVARLTPETAIIICAEHSGSLRYYAHRITLRFDALNEEGLDATIAELRGKGYQSYIVVDDWEEDAFRKRFAATNRIGRLDWTPLATTRTNPEVRLYSTEGH